MIPERLYQFGNVLNSYESDFINSTDEKYSHITAEEKGTVQGKVVEARAWIADVDQKVKKTNKTDTPPFLVKDIDAYWTKFVKDNEAIVNRPKPPPPKPKEEEKKEGEDKKEGEGEKKG